MPTFCDSHAHITSPAIFAMVDEVLARAKNEGVSTIINVATDAAEMHHSLSLMQRYPQVYTAAAVHPHDVDAEGASLFPIFSHFAKEGKLIAVGETGLDYHYTHSTPKTQQHFLREHLQLALQCNLPVIIHCREAFFDLFPILDSAYRTDTQRYGPGVLHCFTGTPAEAEAVLERGWYISLSGIVTFKKSTVLKEIAQTVPLDRLLIETDAPFLAPQSKRSLKNEPSYLPETAQHIADLRGISIEDLAIATCKNTHTLFHVHSF